MDYYKETLKTQTLWLSNLIFSNGEFVMHNSPSSNLYKIVPYFSNLAALALLTEESYIDKVRKYLEWYITHINIPDKFNVYGSIYDYHLSLDGKLISTYDYDSYDSYPATFITLCREYYDATNNKEFFTNHKQSIDLVVDSLIKSMDKDYLTYAKPNHKIKYLMDNCEVFRGLVDCAYIYDVVFNDIDMTKNLYKMAQKNFDAIRSKMYYTKENYYYMIGYCNKAYKPNYSKWYPDATSQLFPILYGLIDTDSKNAKEIYRKFNEYQPNWYNEQNKADFPNTYVGYVAILMNDYDRAAKFIDYCIQRFINNNNKWPWNCFESGYFIRILKSVLKIK